MGRKPLLFEFKIDTTTPCKCKYAGFLKRGDHLVVDHKYPSIRHLNTNSTPRMNTRPTVKLLYSYLLTLLARKKIELNLE